MHESTDRPAWLDLDGVATPGLRADMAALTSEVEALMPTITDICRRYHQLSAAAMAQLPDGGVIADPYEQFADLTGQAQMESAVDRLVGTLWAATDRRAPDHVPSWLETPA